MPSATRRQTRQGAPSTPLDARIPPEHWRVSLVWLAFWGLAAASSLNLNHLANLALGVGWGVTIAIAACCVFLQVVARVPLRESTGTPGYLYVGALLSYCVIGIAVGMFVGLPPLAEAGALVVGRESHISLPARTVVATLVVVASASGAAVLLKHAGVDSLLRGIALVLAAMCCLILLTPLLQDHLYTSEVHHWRYSARWAGPFKDPNLAGLAASNAVVLGLALLNSRSGRRLGAAVAILGTAAVVVTYSRTAIVALVLATAYFLFAGTARQGRASRRARLWLVAALATIGAIAFYASVEHVPFQRAHTQSKRVDLLASVEAWGVPDRRFGIAIHVLPQIADAWLTGNGLFSLDAVEGGPRCRGYSTCSVHNSFLQFWGESGLIPLALLVGSLLLLLRARWRFRHHHAVDAVVGWAIVFVVSCLAFSDVPMSFWYAFLVGVSCALVSNPSHLRLATGQPGGADRAPGRGSSAAVEASP